MKKHLIVAGLLGTLAVSLSAIDYINVMPEEILVELVTSEEMSAFNREYMIAQGVFGPASSSSLPGDQSFSYEAESAADGDVETSWSEGVAGPGIGETLFVNLSVPRVEGDAHLYVLPGWGGSESTWERNNRVARARISVYGFFTFTMTGDLDWDYHATVERFTVAFEDRQAHQGFPIGRYVFPEEGPQNRRVETYLVLIEILDVYPGSRWDDTVIAEVSLSSENLSRR